MELEVEKMSYDSEGAKFSIGEVVVVRGGRGWRIGRAEEHLLVKGAGLGRKDEVEREMKVEKEDTQDRVHMITPDGCFHHFLSTHKSIQHPFKVFSCVSVNYTSV